MRLTVDYCPTEQSEPASVLCFVPSSDLLSLATRRLCAQLLPFDERVCHSSANEIVVRKLMSTRSPCCCCSHHCSLTACLSWVILFVNDTVPRSPQLLDEVDRFVAAETERDQAERKGARFLAAVAIVRMLGGLGSAHRLSRTQAAGNTGGC